MVPCKLTILLLILIDLNFISGCATNALWNESYKERTVVDILAESNQISYHSEPDGFSIPFKVLNNRDTKNSYQPDEYGYLHVTWFKNNKDVREALKTILTEPNISYVDQLKLTIFKADNFSKSYNTASWYLYLSSSFKPKQVFKNTWHKYRFYNQGPVYIESNYKEDISKDKSIMLLSSGSAGITMMKIDSTTDYSDSIRLLDSKIDDFHFSIKFVTIEENLEYDIPLVARIVLSPFAAAYDIVTLPFLAIFGRYILPPG